MSSSLVRLTSFLSSSPPTLTSASLIDLQIYSQKNRIISCRAEGCSAPADVIFHAGSNCRPVFFFFLSSPSPVYLWLDLFFGASGGAVHHGGPVRDRLTGRSCRCSAEASDTPTHTSKAAMNNLALRREESGIWRVIRTLARLREEHSCSEKMAKYL